MMVLAVSSGLSVGGEGVEEAPVVEGIAQQQVEQGGRGLSKAHAVGAQQRTALLSRGTTVRRGRTTAGRNQPGTAGRRGRPAAVRRRTASRGRSHEAVGQRKTRVCWGIGGRMGPEIAEHFTSSFLE